MNDENGTLTNVILRTVFAGMLATKSAEQGITGAHLALHSAPLNGFRT